MNELDLSAEDWTKYEYWSKAEGEQHSFSAYDADDYAWGLYQDLCRIRVGLESLGLNDVYVGYYCDGPVELDPIDLDTAEKELRGNEGR